MTYQRPPNRTVLANWYRAALAGDLLTLEAGIKRGIDVNLISEEREALTLAVCYSQIETVNFLFARGAVPRSPNAILASAVTSYRDQSKSPEILGLLLAQPWATPDQSNSALCHAIQNRSPMADQLLEWGASLNFFNRDISPGLGDTAPSPLIAACFHDVDRVPAFLAAGADPNLALPARPYGQTPTTTVFHLICSRIGVPLSTMKLLIDAGADLSARDHLGRTPLLCAAAKGPLPLLEHLLAHPSVDTKACDLQGQNVRDLLKQRKNAGIGQDPSDMLSRVLAILQRTEIDDVTPNPARTHQASPRL
jgi:ankyrin repeat protein